MPENTKSNKKRTVQDSELEIIANIRNGDAIAFRTLFKSYYQPLVKYARRYVQDAQTSEDIVCDVFLKIWQEREKFKIKISVKAYLYRMVGNHSLNYLKIKKPDQVDDFSLNLSLSGSAADEQANLNEMAKYIQEAIAELPERSRSVFTMHRYDNLKYSEIADILNIAEGTVETHMVRALKFLRKRLAFLLTVLAVFIKM